MKYKFNKNSIVGFCNARFGDQPLEELAAYCLGYLSTNEYRSIVNPDRLLLWRQEVFTSSLLQELFTGAKESVDLNPYQHRSTAPNSLKTTLNTP